MTAGFSWFLALLRCFCQQLSSEKPVTVWWSKHLDAVNPKAWKLPQQENAQAPKTMDGAIQQRNALLNWHSHGLSLFAKMPPGVKEEVDWSSRAP